MHKRANRQRRRILWTLLDPKDAVQTSQQYGSETPFRLNPSSFPPQRNLLFNNRGDGSFEELAEAAGVDNPSGRSLSAQWSDFDEDGWPDLYVANDVSDNALYHNEGDGVFQDMGLEAWVADYRGAMGLAVGDGDGDRDLDLFVTHWIAQENAYYVNLVEAAPLDAELRPGQATAASRPSPRFNDRADMFGLGQIALDYIGWGTAFLDFDLDGRLDLAVVNGSTFQDPSDSSQLLPMRGLLFWNAGEAGYFELGEVAGPAFTEPRVSRGLAVADYDNDGDEDLFAVDFGGSPRLIRNPGGTGHHWLKVRLRGPAGNRHGVGARITLKAGGRFQVREIGAGSSYLSQHAMEAVFGLGEAGVADAITVRWPDGSLQEVGAVPADRIIQIEMGAGWSGPDADAAAPPSLDRETTLRFWEHYRDAVQTMRQSADWAAAAAGFEAALAIDPSHQESIYNLGNCLVEMGEIEGALARFEQLVALNPLSLRGHLQIGNLRASPASGALFDLAAAEAAYTRSVAINPEESGALIQLGAVAVARGALGAAGEHLASARRFNPKSVEAFYLGGYLAWEADDAAEASMFLSEAIRLSATEPPVEAVPGEGATLTGRALLVETLQARRLFGQRLAALSELDPTSTPSPAAVDSEYSALRAEIAALGR